ncbi:hypothetical protein CRYUN_Cryun12cG0114800 [Craigia yunnanensis]
MHYQLFLSTPSISIFTFFFISLFILPISHSQDDENFDPCFIPFKCGDIENLKFPFWTEDRPQFCHQEGFNLTKCEDPQPVINIGGNEFRLIYLNNSTYTMTIARNDLWEQICPSNPITVELDNPFLRYSQTNQKSTFFYNCNSSLPPPAIKFECTQGLYSFYAADYLVERDHYEDFNLFCRSAIQVQVNQSSFTELQNEGPQSLEDWKRGFDVVYNPKEIFCQKCNSLNGKCANLTASQYPICKIPEHESFRGYPNFKITCKEENPILKISEDSYIIKDIFYNNNSLLVVNAVVYGDDCPTPRQNVSLDRTPFSVSLDNVNLSFLYNCEEQPEYHIYPVSCASNASFHSFAVFHKKALENTNYSVESCQTLVDAPVFIKDDVNFVSLLAMNYTEVLRTGIVLNWTAHSCSNCKRSGGRCGFDNTNEFICFCSDGSHPKTCNDDGFNLGRKLGIGFGAGAGGIIISCIGFYCWLRRRRGNGFFKSSFVSGKNSSYSSSVMDPEKGNSFAGIHLFTYNELEEATNNFDSDRELGDGGFGTVYYGKLPDGRAVAVKRLYENNYKRVEQFMNEVEILTHMRHQNLVSLYGCTSRHSRELLLVYEYVPNGTVADHLHGERAKPGALSWPIRLEIAIETANVLRYLHASETIHRDVKTNNILLDNNFSVKVADFGLSRLFPTDVTHVSTAPQGTPGYVDPEYHQCYRLTDKSDVFSFGVVLVELISSKPAVDITRHRHEINLSNMAINKIQNRALHELVDPSLGFESDYKVRKMITEVAEVAFQCLQNEKDMRPTMAQVLEALMGIQNEDYNKEKAEEMNISADEVVLLKSGPLPQSPDTVMIKWVSSSSTTLSISN